MRPMRATLWALFAVTALCGVTAACTRTPPATVRAVPCGTASAPVSPPTSAPAAWMDRSASPDERAARLVSAMTLDEKLTVLTGYFGTQVPTNDYRFPEARLQSAGLVRGVPRLGLTPQWQSDAGSGVATQGEPPAALERTLLPSG